MQAQVDAINSKQKQILDQQMVEKREKWTDAHPQAPVAWSPQGTYLATFHRQGICLWGGKKWARYVGACVLRVAT